VIAEIARDRETHFHRGGAEITKKLPEAEIAKESKLKTTEGAINSGNFGIYGR